MIQDAVGLTGMFIILFAFIMIQTKKWKDDSLLYDASNAVGSLLLMIYAYFLNSYPFLILNFVWFAVSAKDTFFDIKKKK